MKIAITGASGFIGRYVVQHALMSGMHVVALDRNGITDMPDHADKLTVFECDLAKTDSLVSVISGCDYVIHLAAVVQGSPGTQYEETLEITRNVLAAMEKAGVEKLISLSSIAVLDYVECSAGSLIDENLPINERDSELGCYALMKRDQERLLYEWYSKLNRVCIIVRPGIVYDEQRLSSAHAGFVTGSRCIAVSHDGEVPLVHVKYLARKITGILNLNNSENQIVHLVDESLPNQKTYLKLLQENSSVKIIATLPWQFYAFLSIFIRFIFRIVSMGNKIPDSFMKNSVAARNKPFKFSNQKAISLLD